MKFSKLFIIFSIFTVVVFAVYPELDLRVSELFYKEDGGFYLRYEQPFAFFHDELKSILIVTFVFLVILLIYQSISSNVLKYLNKKAILFLFTFLLIGPGLVTNVVFKENSTRDRPRQILHFDKESDKSFHPYYSLDGKCESNCSFISGHASAAFFFLAFGYIYRSRVVFALAFTFGAMMSLSRIVQGAHFFSDVLFAFIINLIVLKMIYYLFYKESAVLEESL